MRIHSSAKFSITMAMSFCIALSLGVIAFRAQADQWDKKTILTVDQTIQVRETVLGPGKYVFKLLDSNSDRHIVQIFNSDQSHVIDTILAIPNYRLRPTGRSQFVFWETPPGNTRALRAWFYPGDNFGQEFAYPKHLMQLAVLRAPEPPPTPAPAPEGSLAQPTAPAESPAAAPETPKQEPPPVETAQSTPPPAPAPETPPPAAEKLLPKTASPYPLIGLVGLLSLGIYAVLRLARAVPANVRAQGFVETMPVTDNATAAGRQMNRVEQVVSGDIIGTPFGSSATSPVRNCAPQKMRKTRLFAITTTLMLVTTLLIATGCRTNETPEKQVSDIEVTSIVKAKLVEGIGATSVTNISVNVTNGVVTLAGTVHNAEEKSKALAIAQGVPKVVKINDNLQISAGASD